jgi:hypothetical protein
MLFSARSRFLLLASLATVAVLAFAGSAAASERSLAAAAPNDALSRALASGQITGAQYSLQRALAILAPRLADARYASAAAHANPREATMALRDLAARIGSLSRSDRRLAMRLLARPTDGASEGLAGYVRVPKANRKHLCTTRFCVHWVTRGSERPSLVDRNRNGRPDYIDKTVRTMNTVWGKEIGSFGYKKPRSDLRSGSHHGGNPNGRIDIFIANIGNRGLYGYCTTDDPLTNRNTHRQTSAYCVFDNDFRRAEFTTGAFGLAALKVTAAHEFFHAIQFAYDLFEDRAFMEGTATWMEDEVFTGVNDNIQYLLRGSPMDPVNNATRGPWISLDAGRQSTQYGTWIWYRFLTEVHGDPIIKQIWVRAVGKANYGFKAIADILVARGTSLTAMLAQFGSWNAAPGFYTEGALYPTAGAVPGRERPQVGPGSGRGSHVERWHAPPLERLSRLHAGRSIAGGADPLAQLPVGRRGGDRDPVHHGRRRDPPSHRPRCKRGWGSSRPVRHCNREQGGSRGHERRQSVRLQPTDDLLLRGAPAGRLPEQRVVRRHGPGLAGADESPGSASREAGSGRLTLRGERLRAGHSHSWRRTRTRCAGSSPQAQSSSTRTSTWGRTSTGSWPRSTSVR